MLLLHTDSKLVWNNYKDYYKRRVWQCECDEGLTHIDTGCYLANNHLISIGGNLSGQAICLHLLYTQTQKQTIVFINVRKKTLSPPFEIKWFIHYDLKPSLDMFCAENMPMET